MAAEYICRKCGITSTTGNDFYIYDSKICMACHVFGEDNIQEAKEREFDGTLYSSVALGVMQALFVQQGEWDDIVRTSFNYADEFMAEREKRLKEKTL